MPIDLLPNELIKQIVLISIFIWVSFFFIYILGFLLLKKVFQNKLSNRKIFETQSNQKQHKSELFNAIRTNIIFNITAIIIVICYDYQINLLHDDLSTSGIIIGVFLSYFLLHHFHDAYFYWTHRAMHEIKWLKKFHVTHHQSKTPTALSAISFSLVEASIHAGLYLIASFIIPAHWAMLLFFFLFVSWISMWGHCEFEFWPSSLYRLPYANTFNTITHHNLHHHYGKGNYGLYYRFWDELCGTLHPETYPTFYKTKSKLTNEPPQRPDATDNVGLYFEQIHKFGEEIGIILDTTPPFFGIKSFHHKDLNTYPHSFCDGISAMKLFHKEKKAELKFETKPKNSSPPSSLEKIKKILIELPQVIKNMPYSKYSWETNDNSSDILQTISLNSDQTQRLKNKSKLKKESFNFSLINQIDNASKVFLETRNWLIPVWHSESAESPSKAKIKNNAFFIEYKSHDNQTYEYYKNQLKSGSFYLWKTSFKFMMFPLKFFFIPMAKLSLFALKRTGVISNIGSFSGDIKDFILFCPPTITNCPLSIGIVEYNKNLSITFRSKAKYGPNQEVLKQMTSFLYQTWTK